MRYNDCRFHKYPSEGWIFVGICLYHFQVILTTLSNRVCRKIGFAKKDNLGGALVVNTRIELCGAFINTMEVAYVNYTVDQKNPRAKKQQEFTPQHFKFSELDPKHMQGKKTKSLFR